MTVVPHAGVRVAPVPEGARVTDRATEIDVVVPTDALDAFLVRNGLARSPGTRPSTVRWTGADRTVSRLPGIVGAWEATVLAVVRAYGVVALGLGIALAAVFAVTQAPERLVAGAAVAPLLTMIVVVVHEAAHWSVLRILRGGDIGAIVVGWRTCMVVHAALPPRQDRLVAVSGPGAGLLVSAGSLAVTYADFAGAYTSVVLVIVNLLGLTPVSSDGRRVLGAERASAAL